MRERPGSTHDAARAGTAAPAPRLSQELRAATAEVHARAERGGIVAALLGGRATRHGYALYLRNLLPAYRSMERGLEVSRALRPLARPELFRAAAIESDLRALDGERFEARLALLAPARAYAERIEQAAMHEPGLLAAHAYVRYLGDLSGGRIVGRTLGRSLGLDETCLAFYRFEGIASPTAFKAEYRRALDAWGAEPALRAAIVGEAVQAFRHNVAVSEAVAVALHR